MEGYLGESPVDLSQHGKLASYSPTDWALMYIMLYGGIDGEHHKAWVLDQVARILGGTPVNVTEARWENGATELRYSTGEPGAAYLAWREQCLDRDEHGEPQYDYDEGIAP